MSIIPTHAKQVDTIAFDSLHYLVTETETVGAPLTTENFDVATGKPLHNMTDAFSESYSVDVRLLTSVSQNLQESVNINEQFVFDFPMVLDVETSRDLVIGADPTEIRCIFVSEGASMENSFGYYFYVEDPTTGDRFLLDSAADSGGYHYSPTVVFPHVLDESLATGTTRLLKGNMPDGKFANVRVGFFLVPHGWFALRMNSTVPNDSILYSTTDFCTKYVQNDYEMVNDKIYSIFAKAANAAGNDLLLVGFEDIFYRGTFDMDYNDCVVGLHANPSHGITNRDQFVTIDVPDTIHVASSGDIRIFFDLLGEFVQLPDSVLANEQGYNYIFTRTIRFASETRRNATADALNQLLDNFHVGDKVVGFNAESFPTLPYFIKATYLFRKNDILQSVKIIPAKGRGVTKKKLYLMQVKFTKHHKIAAERYLREVIHNFRAAAANPIEYKEEYEIRTTTGVEVLTVIDGSSPFRENEIGDRGGKVTTDGRFHIVGSGLMTTLQGRSHLPFKSTTIIQVYKRNELVVNIMMDTHPDDYMLGKKTFVRRIGFVWKPTNTHLVVDLADLSLYQVDADDNGALLPLGDASTLSGFGVGDVTSNSADAKHLIKMFRTNSDAIYRVVTIDDTLPFWCIRLPRVKNNPTVVYLAADGLQDLWTKELELSASGTFFDKQTFPEVASLSST